MNTLTAEPKTVEFSDNANRKSLIGSLQSEDCIESLEAIYMIGDIIDEMEERLSSQAEDMNEMLAATKRRETAASEKIHALEETVRSQEEKYVKLAALLEAKLVENADLKASFSQAKEEGEWMERHIKTVTHEIMSLKKRLRPQK